MGARRTIARVAGGLLAGMVLVGAPGCMTTPDAGEIGVVRNGGPFDNHQIRQVVPNGSGNTWNGFYSKTHYYPVDSQQRFFRMGSGDNADSPPVTVPTSDGVEVTIEGTFYLNTVFNNGKPGKAAVEAFDTQFATRTFGPDGLHAYEGNDGWSAFLSAIVEPIVVNNLRDTVAGVSCSQLVSSCALVQNQSGKPAELVSGKNNQANVASVQQAVSKGLAVDLNQTLKRRYFGNVTFKLSRVVLPPKVQNAINDAQSAFAEISRAQAKIQSAKADAAANEERQHGYNSCPTCARIDAIRALPRGLTALGGNFAVGVK
jgi:hypothetical protein